MHDVRSHCLEIGKGVIQKILYDRFHYFGSFLSPRIDFGTRVGRVQERGSSPRAHHEDDEREDKKAPFRWIVHAVNVGSRIGPLTGETYPVVRAPSATSLARRA